MTRLPCIKCQGEGKTANEQCEACEGSGNQRCEERSCEEDAVGFDNDGNALCEDCLVEWVTKEFGQ